MKRYRRTILGWLSLTLIPFFLTGCSRTAADEQRGWKLSNLEVNGRAENLPSGFEARLDAFDRASDGGQLTGYSGVNTFACRLVRSNGCFRVEGPVVATRRGASAEFMRLETVILRTIEGGELEPTNRNLTLRRDGTVLQFEPKP